MSVPVDWEPAVARFYNTHEREWDRVLGPSPKEPGCRAPAHVLRAYGYRQASGCEARSVQHSVSQKGPPKAKGAIPGDNTTFHDDPVWGPTVLTPPIKLFQMDDWLRQVLADPKLPASAKNVAVSIALHLNREK